MFEVQNSLQQTPWLVLLNILMICGSFLLLKKALKNPYVISKKTYSEGFCICLLFCLFSFWGSDWFHYYEAFISIKEGYNTNLEDVYIWIIEYLSPKYIIFRLIVWGCALYILFRTIEILSTPKGLVLFLFSTIYIIWFSYARVSLAMSLAFYGYALIVKNNTSLVSILFGLLILIISYFFHKSSMFAIAVIALSLLLKRYPRYTIWIVLFTFPAIIVCANMGIADFMNASVDGDSSINSYMAAGQRYMDADSTLSGIGGILQRFLERVPYYLTAYVSFDMINKDSTNIPNDIKAFMVLQILIVAAASVFAFNLGVNTSTVYGRFMRFAIIPTTVVLAYLYQSRYRWRFVRFTVNIATVGTLYALLYSFYNTLV